jgi:sphingomyelin phosphodiesterase 4
VNRAPEFLSHDASCLFEFSAAKVPQQKVAAGSVMQNKEGEAVLVLTPFEYYMYHFTSLVNQNLEWNNGAGMIVENDSLYPLIFEDYLATYLTMGGGNFKSHDLIQSPMHRPQSQSSPPLTTRLSLLKSDLTFHHAASPAVQRTASSAYSSSTATAVFSEAWKSNVFVDAVTKFWVNACTTSNSTHIPSADVIKLVRMFIKHTHFFFNSFHPGQYDLRDSLRRGTFGPFFAGLGRFFEQLIDHWPLDASFRLVLETWLSYIQPWRYRDIRDGIHQYFYNFSIFFLSFL